MLGYIKGQVIAKTDKTLIISAGGVGYSLYTTGKILDKTALDAEVEFYLHTNVREDALELYALKTLEEIEFFKKLIGISGVGPKTALGIFELAKLEDIFDAIARGDASLLTRVSGIGKKTAELIIVKLKDKKIELMHDASGSAHGDAIDALVSLGYPLATAREALTKIPASLTDTAEQVRAVLKLLSKH